jgi:hypothetical protein
MQLEQNLVEQMSRRLRMQDLPKLQDIENQSHQKERKKPSCYTFDRLRTRRHSWTKRLETIGDLFLIM